MKCKKQKQNKQKTDHITPILRQLHWLPIQKQICHKNLSATYRSVPLYLSDLQEHNPSRLLRSASRSLLDVPGPRDSQANRYVQRAFRYVAPSLWNVLPESIKEKDSIQSFRPLLKPISLPRDDSQYDCVRALALTVLVSLDPGLAALYIVSASNPQTYRNN